MKKHRSKPQKQKKPRKLRSREKQDHSLKPGSGLVCADAVWSGIKRAQPNHRERTFSEMWERSKRMDFWSPEFTPAEVMGIA
uniref:Uncharacterized protein n=1 Tax=Pseudomonas phage RVTF4 TaxID=3236931 RepID=A0AB39CCT4_9VIRU